MPQAYRFRREFPPDMKTAALLRAGDAFRCRVNSSPWRGHPAGSCRVSEVRILRTRPGEPRTCELTVIARDDFRFSGPAADLAKLLAGWTEG